MKKIVFTLIISGLVLSGCSIPFGKLVGLNGGVVLKAVGNDMVEVSVESKNKISAVAFDIRAEDTAIINGFESNKEVFNSELKNDGTASNWEVSLGAMTATSELPNGKIVLGNIKYSGDGKLIVSNIKLVGPGVEGGEPVETMLEETEYSVKK